MSCGRGESGSNSVVSLDDAMIVCMRCNGAEREDEDKESKVSSVI